MQHQHQMRGCVSAVTPFLNQEKRVEKWKVDTTNLNKILTVEGSAVGKKEVIEAIEKAGFRLSRSNKTTG